MQKNLLLVGSVPLPTAEDVIRMFGATLGRMVFQRQTLSIYFDVLTNPPSRTSSLVGLSLWMANEQ